MTGSWQFYCVLMIVSIALQGFFTMMEMGIISFNRIRLQYYINQGRKKYIWLGRLLENPIYLFGTTLIGVNFFLQLGSESSRLFYMHLGLSPKWTFLSQILAVLIFAELVPMFVARFYAEHVTRLGIRIIFFLSKLFTPIIWVLNGLCLFIDKILRSPPKSGNYLTRDELQSAIEAKEEGIVQNNPELNSMIEIIFSCKEKQAKDFMEPLDKVSMISYDSRIRDIKPLLQQSFVPYLPIYYKEKNQILGLVYTRDLFRLVDDIRVRESMHSPWFITEDTKIFQIIKQFRWNGQRLAVVLNKDGQTTGILTRDSLIDELFHNTMHPGFCDIKAPIIIDRSFPISDYVTDINASLHINLSHREGDTLLDLLEEKLGHTPHKSESVIIGSYRLTLEESPLLSDKRIRIQSL